MDRRRFLLTSLAGVLTAPLAAETQQAGKVWRIGLLCANFCDSVTASTVRPMNGLVEGLRDAGYIDGHNLSVEFRGAGVADNRLDTVAARLAGNNPDVIVAAGTSAAALLRFSLRICTSGSSCPCSYAPPAIRVLVKGAKIQVVKMHGGLAELVKAYAVATPTSRARRSCSPTILATTRTGETSNG